MKMITKENLQKINDYLWEIPQSFHKEMRVPARIYASEKMLDSILKDRSIPQLINGCALPGITKYGIAMPDCHEGYSVPIGFVGALRTSDGVISPGACGFDINCGMKLLKSSWQVKDIQPYLRKLTERVYQEVPSGLGKGRKVRLSIEQIDRILEGGAQYVIEQGYGEKEDGVFCEAGGRLDWAEAAAVSFRAKNRGRDQLGTLGSGNHFLEIQKVEEIFDEKTAQTFGLFKGQVVVMIHCGSRGLGHQVCTDYLREFVPLMLNKYKIKLSDKEFACVPFSSSEGQRYFRAMACAANFAWANRQVIAHYVRKAWQDVLGVQAGKLVSLYDVAHNIIKLEKHLVDGKETELVVHRKGSTRAFPPGHPELPPAYQEAGQPVLIPGSMGTASYILAGTAQGREAFYSTCHGAGRRMSRHQALKTTRGEDVKKNLEEKGILIKAGSFRGIAEEAPVAYKDVDNVVEVVARAGIARKVVRLRPLAVIKG